MRPLALVVVWILGSCMATPSPRYPSAELIGRMERSTVRVEIWCDDPFSPGSKRVGGLGSGVAIRPNLILTVEHVATLPPSSACQRPEYRIVRHDGKTFRGMTVAANEAHDIALIETAPEFAPAPLGPPPALGADVCGYGWDGPDYVTESGALGYLERPPVKCGIVTRVTGDLVVANFHGVKGNSGSGFWDRQGRVIGVVSQAEPNGERDTWTRGPLQAPRLPELLAP